MSFWKWIVEECEENFFVLIVTVISGVTLVGAWALSLVLTYGATAVPAWGYILYKYYKKRKQDEDDQAIP